MLVQQWTSWSPSAACSRCTSSTVRSPSASLKTGVLHSDDVICFTDHSFSTGVILIKEMTDATFQHATLDKVKTVHYDKECCVTFVLGGQISFSSGWAESPPLSVTTRRKL